MSISSDRQNHAVIKTHGRKRASQEGHWAEDRHHRQKDMGYQTEQGGPMPGISVFHRNENGRGVETQG